MKPIIKELAKGVLGDGFIKQIGDVADKFVPTGEKREEAKRQLLTLVQDYQAKMQSELTERLRIDTNSDSWLAKNIRPMSLVFTTVLVTLLAFTDGNLFGFEVKQAYIDLLQSIMTLQYVFYFGSRGVEKVMTTLNSFKPIKRRRKRHEQQENL